MQRCFKRLVRAIFNQNSNNWAAGGEFKEILQTYSLMVCQITGGHPITSNKQLKVVMVDEALLHGGGGGGGYTGGGGWDLHY